jgi:hypothetical protein
MCEGSGEVAGMMTLKIDGGDKVEIIGESFVSLTYEGRGAGDLYVELDRLSLPDREHIVSIREQMISLSKELADHLLAVTSKQAA